MSGLVPKFSGKVIAQNGTKAFVLDDKQKLSEYVKTLEIGGYELKIARKRTLKDDRSTEQNRYYWGVPIKLLAEYTGFTKDEIHEALRVRFLRVARLPLDTYKSTTELTTAEMEEYLKNIREWASVDLGVYIPEPNEVAYE